MFRDSSNEPGRSDKDVDIKDRTQKHDSCKEVEVADNEPQCFMKWSLKSIGLLQYMFGDGVLVAILDIGKTNGLERTAGAFLMAKYAPLSCLGSILIGGVERGDNNEEQ